MTMVRLFHRFMTVSPRKWAAWFLALCWSVGLFCGILVFVSTGTVLIPPETLCRVSVGNLIMANLLPFLFSVFAVYIHQPILILPIAFLKGSLFSFVSMGVMASFGSAGWLVRGLLMFSDLLLSGLLYFYWLRHISGLRRFSIARCGALAAAAVLVGWVDYRWIAPILAGII